MEVRVVMINQALSELNEIGTVKSCWQTVFQVWTKLRLILYHEALMINFETFSIRKDQAFAFEYRGFE